MAGAVCICAAETQDTASFETRSNTYTHQENVYRWVYVMGYDEERSGMYANSHIAHKRFYRVYYRASFPVCNMISYQAVKYDFTADLTGNGN